MAENTRAVGSVTYTGGRRRLFRKAETAPSCRLLVAVGTRRRRRDLRRLLRLEPRPRRGRLRRPADRRRSSSRSCITACASPSRRCRLPCRTPAAPTRSRARRWARGAASSPAWPRTWSTSSRLRWSSARWASCSHDIVFDLTGGRRLVEQPGALVGRLLHHLRRHQHPRHRDHHAVHRDHHRRGARRPRVLLRRGSRQREVRRQPADQHPAGRGPDQLPAARRRRYLPRATVRDLVLPRDRGTAVGRRGIPRSEARHPPRDDLGTHHADVLRRSESCS